MEPWIFRESLHFLSGFYLLQCAITFAILDSSSATTALEQDHGPQKVRKGDPSTVVALAITDKSTVDMLFPNLKFVNDSTEFHDENKRIAKDSVMISGVSSRFGKRSVRAYPSASQLMMMTGLENQYNNNRNFNRFNRFDNRHNGVDSGDDHSSSWGGKWFNTLRRRTSMMMNPMMSQSHGSADEPEMAATFLGGSGWGQSSHYGKGSVKKSAVGLLGFLSLLSLIQNVLNQTQAMQGRRKRDVTDVSEFEEDFEFGDYDWEQSVSEMTKLTPYLIPMLNAVTYAQSGKIPVKCTLQPICLINHALVNQLNRDRGQLVGQIISDALSKSLKHAEKRWKASNNGDMGGRVVQAGKSGRNGKPCEVIYKKCPELDLLPSYHVSSNAVTTWLSQLRQFE